MVTTVLSLAVCSSNRRIATINYKMIVFFEKWTNAESYCQLQPLCFSALILVLLRRRHRKKRNTSQHILLLAFKSCCRKRIETIFCRHLLDYGTVLDWKSHFAYSCYWINALVLWCHWPEQERNNLELKCGLYTQTHTLLTPTRITLLIIQILRFVFLLLLLLLLLQHWNEITPLHLWMQSFPFRMRLKLDTVFKVLLRRVNGGSERQQRKAHSIHLFHMLKS